MPNKTGPKLGRSEVVTVRLKKDVKKAAQLKAYQDGRTLSSWIEEVIKKHI